MVKVLQIPKSLEIHSTTSLKMLTQIQTKLFQNLSKVQRLTLNRINYVKLSFITGIFPVDMKVSKIVPTFKSESSEDLNNYRPISQLSVFSKVIEKMMHQSRTATHMGYTRNTGIYWDFFHTGIYTGIQLFFQIHIYWDIFDLTKAITKLEEDLKKLQWL